ncbi:MAG: Ku protein [Syntrophomonadaceae bacterium]|nr:Ku protein [Syntrophomonadaceae bacterium]
MRSLWKGFLSFGLVNIPVKLYTATEKKDLKFRYLHQECMTPIQYQKRCPTCDREVEQREIVYGYEYQKGHFVVVNEDDFAQIPAASSRTVDILDFADLSQVDPVYFDKSYYLEPGEGGAKSYSLLVKAMETTGKVAIARVVIRSKESLAAVRVKDGILLMETMFYFDEVRSSQGLTMPGDNIQIHDNETRMAVNLIESLASDFEPSKYQNQSRQTLRELIDAKIEGKDIQISPAEPAANVIDLMDALKQSVKIAEKQRKKPRAKKAGAGT